MDYYEELGLKPSASVQEIRRAYKVLARLVHPDGQAHEPVRGMAERQMKRLNEILATLTNEQARRDYDATLSKGAARAENGPACPARGLEWRQTDLRLVPMPEWIRPLAENWFWIALSVILVGVGLWYLAQSRPEEAAAGLAPENKPPSEEVKPAKGRAVKTMERRAAPQNQPQPSKRPPQVGKVEAPPADSSPPPAPRETSMDVAEKVAPTAPPGHPEGADSAPPPPPVEMHGSPFAGNWVYVPDASETPVSGAYSATYVELLLAEQHGRLRGTYRAEYRVSDRAVSPEVTFEMEGDAPQGTSASFRWTSADGARGDVDLALEGANVLKITWWTTAFGRHPALASGMSRLIRQEAP